MPDGGGIAALEVRSRGSRILAPVARLVEKAEQDKYPDAGVGVPLYPSYSTMSRSAGAIVGAGGQ